MSGAIPPLSQYAFMVWCLVKHRDNFTFTFMSGDRLFHMRPVVLRLSAHTKVPGSLLTIVTSIEQWGGGVVAEVDETELVSVMIAIHLQIEVNVTCIEIHLR
jgi:hypothetical protein